MAGKLDAGFIPVSKSGKPSTVKISQSYNLGYGKDILEILNDSTIKGENVLIHYDVLATRGAAQAVCRLVERLGGNIIAFNFLIELDFLKGREKLKGQEVQPLINH